MAENRLQIDEQCVIANLKSSDKEGVLRELAEAVHHRCPQVDIEKMVDVLLEREQVGSTGVGNEVAIPHAKLANLEQLLLCLGRSQKGIPFDAVDKRPVHIFIMILSPKEMAAEYLQTLARVSRLLKNREWRNRLRHAGSAAEMVSLFTAADREQAAGEKKSQGGL